MNRFSAAGYSCHKFSVSYNVELTSSSRLGLGKSEWLLFLVQIDEKANLASSSGRSTIDATSNGACLNNRPGYLPQCYTLYDVQNDDIYKKNTCH